MARMSGESPALVGGRQGVGSKPRGGQRSPPRGDGSQLPVLHTPAPPASNPQALRFIFYKNSTWRTEIWETRHSWGLGWGERLKTGRLNSMIRLWRLWNLSLTNSRKTSCLLHVTHGQDTVGLLERDVRATEKTLPTLPPQQVSCFATWWL